MYGAYSRIFARCGLDFRAVEADTGNIGGNLSHEFQVLADSGEDTIVSCNSCEYAANVEKAEMRPASGEVYEAAELAKVDTPQVRTIEEVSAFLGLAAERFIKTLLFIADETDGVAALVRGDDQVSETKLKALLGAGTLRMAEPEEIEKLTGGPQGFSGPVGLSIPVWADHRLAGCRGMVTGANAADTHLTGVEQERDFADARFADLRAAVGGDACARCQDGVFTIHRGIEVGHIFYLGRKYSEALGCSFLDADGNDRIMEMGTYGIGVTRTMAAAIEQNHDDKGICWPMAIAPFEVIVVPVKWTDDASREAAETIYAELTAAGVEVLLDDRDERAGVKFNDADLVGIPLRITIGPRALAEGNVELKGRREAEASAVALGEVVETVAARVRAGRETADV
jgi:prolyl-tRNA synthetase